MSSQKERQQDVPEAGMKAFWDHPSDRARNIFKESELSVKKRILRFTVESLLLVLACTGSGHMVRLQKKCLILFFDCKGYTDPLATAI